MTYGKKPKLSLPAFTTKKRTREVKKLDMERLSADVAAVAIEARLRQRIEEINWRSDRVVFIRRTLAWAFNIFIVLFACFVSLIYALKFGEGTMNSCLVSWAVAYGWSFLIIEPMQ